MHLFRHFAALAVRLSMAGWVSRMGKKTGYPSDVTEEEWQFVLPYLWLCRKDIPQREHLLAFLSLMFRNAAKTPA